MSDEEQLIQILGPDHVKYQDIISEQDIDFWKYLCNKDFRRLQKLLTQGLGDGIFFDDTESDDSDERSGKLGSDSDEDDELTMQGRNKLSNRRGKTAQEGNKNDGYDEEDDFDHDGFMEQMLAEMHVAQEEEQQVAEKKKKQQLDEESKAENEKAVKQSVFGENQFWSLNDSYDLDDLMEDYDN